MAESFSRTGYRFHRTGLLVRHKVVAVSPGIALVLLLAIPLTGLSGIGAAANGFAHPVSTTAGRDDRGRDAAGMVIDFPVTAVGLGCFAELFARYQRPPWSSVFWDTANNEVVQSVTELGVPGALLMWCAAAVLWRLARSLRLLRAHRILLAAASILPNCRVSAETLLAPQNGCPGRVLKLIGADVAIDLSSIGARRAPLVRSNPLRRRALIRAVR
jgi:hypothetical protein